VRRTLRACCLILFAVCVAGLFGLSASGQEDNAAAHHRGEVQDWSRHHVVYAPFGPASAILGVQHDPRAIADWDASERKEKRRHAHANRGEQADRGEEGDRGDEGDRDEHGEHGQGHHPGKGTLRTDWHISLGAGTIAPGMFPAKFSFDPNAAVTVANCGTDFIVFPVNAAGSATQPNIVGLNNLYSGGTLMTDGLCNAVPPPAGDTGVDATTMWSYNIQGIGAGSSVATSPSLSLDGNKVAFVETKAGNAAHFHVLAWKLGQGVDNTNAQSVLSPATIASFSGTSPAAGSGTATDLTLGSTASDTDTLSSPFIDYAHDVAYVGNDNGKLFRVLNVFCAFSGCAGAAPSLDASVNWGVAGKTVCVGKLTAPVQDGLTGNVFVGCADGKVYGFTPAGVAIPNNPLTVGNGLAFGGVVDPPMIDAVNGFIYAASGNSAGATQVIVQAKTADFTSPVIATLGHGGTANLHDPDFNDNYFSKVTNTPGAPWLLYVPGVDATPTNNILYGITFGAGHAMTAGPPPNQHAIPLAAAEFSPATEFLTSGGEDRLFESALLNVAFNLAAWNISTTFPPAVPGPPESFVSEGSGTSGIVVDNSSPAANANSLYFGSLGAAAPNPNSAVKVTQAGFN
jgi:hypothetical protein